MRLIDADELRNNSLMLYRISNFHPIEGYVQEQVDSASTINAVVLPVNVGDTVYTNFSVTGDYMRKNKRPYACKVVYIALNEKGGYIHIRYECGRIYGFDFNDIGKTVFLTKEEGLGDLGGVK